jgi:hypothetical protein
MSLPAKLHRLQRALSWNALFLWKTRIFCARSERVVAQEHPVVLDTLEGDDFLQRSNR